MHLANYFFEELLYPWQQITYFPWAFLQPTPTCLLAFYWLLARSFKLVWNISFGSNTGLLSNSASWFKKQKQTPLDYKESFCSEVILAQISSHFCCLFAQNISSSTIKLVKGRNKCCGQERVKDCSPGGNICQTMLSWNYLKATIFLCTLSIDLTP